MTAWNGAPRGWNAVPCQRSTVKTDGLSFDTQARTQLTKPGGHQQGRQGAGDGIAHRMPGMIARVPEEGVGARRLIERRKLMDGALRLSVGESHHRSPVGQQHHRGEIGTTWRNADRRPEEVPGPGAPSTFPAPASGLHDGPLSCAASIPASLPPAPPLPPVPPPPASIAFVPRPPPQVTNNNPEATMRTDRTDFFTSLGLVQHRLIGSSNQRSFAEPRRHSRR